MHVGGAEVLAARLARRLSDRYRFVFVCLDHVGELGERLRDDGYPVTVLDRRDGFDLRCTRRLRREIRREQVDLIQAHQYTPFFYSLTTRFLGMRRPILFTEHGRFHPDYPRRKRMLFNRAMLGRKDRVVAVGEAVRQALIVNEGMRPERTEVIYNGIDLSRFEHPSAESFSRVRRELSLTPENFVAVLVGRLDYLKDHLTAVRTAEHVVKVLPQFRLLFVGEGPERGRIEAEIAARGLEDCVRLLGTRHDVPEILHASNACLLTSISEGVPLTLIEGMAAGLPVVSTQVGGVAEVVGRDDAALLAPSGDDVALSESILNLARDAQLRIRLGECGRFRAREMFSEELMHQQYRELFDAMLGVPKPEEVPEPVVV